MTLDKTKNKIKQLTATVKALIPRKFYNTK